MSSSHSSPLKYLAHNEVMDLANELVGTITGEHRLGRLRGSWPDNQIGKDLLEVSHTVKRALHLAETSTRNHMCGFKYCRRRYNDRTPLWTSQVTSKPCLVQPEPRLLSERRPAYGRTPYIGPHCLGLHRRSRSPTSNVGESTDAN